MTIEVDTMAVSPGERALLPSLSLGEDKDGLVATSAGTAEAQHAGEKPQRGDAADRDAVAADSGDAALDDVVDDVVDVGTSTAAADDPLSYPPHSCSVLLAHLPRSATASSVAAFASAAGKVRGVTIEEDDDDEDDDDVCGGKDGDRGDIARNRKPSSFVAAIVDFEDEAAAEAAPSVLGGAPFLCGGGGEPAAPRPLQLQLPPRARVLAAPPRHRLFVGGLERSTPAASMASELEEAVRSLPSSSPSSLPPPSLGLVDVSLVPAKDGGGRGSGGCSGTNRGFGFLTYRNAACASLARRSLEGGRLVVSGKVSTVSSAAAPSKKNGGGGGRETATATATTSGEGEVEPHAAPPLPPFPPRPPPAERGIHVGGLPQPPLPSEVLALADGGAADGGAADGGAAGEGANEVDGGERKDASTAAAAAASLSVHLDKHRAALLVALRRAFSPFGAIERIVLLPKASGGGSASGSRAGTPGVCGKDQRQHRTSASPDFAFVYFRGKRGSEAADAVLAAAARAAAGEGAGGEGAGGEGAGGGGAGGEGGSGDSFGGSFPRLFAGAPGMSLGRARCAAGGGGSATRPGPPTTSAGVASAEAAPSRRGASPAPRGGGGGRSGSTARETSTSTAPLPRPFPSRLRASEEGAAAAAAAPVTVPAPAATASAGGVPGGTFVPVPCATTSETAASAAAAEEATGSSAAGGVGGPRRRQRGSIDRRVVAGVGGSAGPGVAGRPQRGSNSAPGPYSRPPPVSTQQHRQQQHHFDHRHQPPPPAPPLAPAPYGFVPPPPHLLVAPQQQQQQQMHFQQQQQQMLYQLPLAGGVVGDGAHLRAYPPPPPPHMQQMQQNAPLPPAVLVQPFTMADGSVAYILTQQQQQIAQQQQQIAQQQQQIARQQQQIAQQQQPPQLQPQMQQMPPQLLQPQPQLHQRPFNEPPAPAHRTTLPPPQQQQQQAFLSGAAHPRPSPPPPLPAAAPVGTVAAAATGAAPPPPPATAASAAAGIGARGGVGGLGVAVGGRRRRYAPY